MRSAAFDVVIAERDNGIAGDDAGLLIVFKRGVDDGEGERRSDRIGNHDGVAALIAADLAADQGVANATDVNVVNRAGRIGNRDSNEVIAPGDVIAAIGAVDCQVLNGDVGRIRYGDQRVLQPARGGVDRVLREQSDRGMNDDARFALALDGQV